MDVAGLKSALVNELRQELRNVSVYRGRPSISDGAFAIVGRITAGGWNKEALGGVGSSYRGVMRIPVTVGSAAGYNRPETAETQTYAICDQVVTTLYDFEYAGLHRLEPVEWEELTTWDETPDQTFSVTLVFEALFYGPPFLGGTLRLGP